MSRRCAWALAALLVGCAPRRSPPRPTPVPLPTAPSPPEPELQPLVTMRCSDADPMGGVAYEEIADGDFRLHFLPGTAADRERQEIIARRRDAVTAITKALGVTELRIFDLWLSPSRAAATAHDLKAGQTRGARVEVLYLDGPLPSYERSQYGHELTHVVTQLLDSKHRHLLLVDEGVAEVFDQSGRDLHLAFARAIRGRGTSVDEALVTAPSEPTTVSYPKAGSFVKRLFEIDPEPMKFRRFFRRTRVESSLDPEGIDALLDTALREIYGVDLVSFRRTWKAMLEPLVARPAPVSPADAAEIANVVRTRDAAIAARNAADYRATIDGFYCLPSWGDPERDRAASDAVAGGPRRSRILEIVDTGLKNYSTVSVHLEVEEAGATRRQSEALERFPVGYRFTGIRSTR